MKELASKKKSRIVLALDFPFTAPESRNTLLEKAENALEDTHPYVCAVKFNHHLVLPLGAFDGVKKLVNTAHQKGLLTIMDAKINDIGPTNQVIAEYYFAAGFDAIIANPFIGWEEGLKPIFETAKKHDRGVILLNYMSHKGAVEGYGQTIIDPKTGLQTKQYLAFAQKTFDLNADGAVVGATVPARIQEISQILKDKVPIYSPGVGAQGGSAETTIKAGASYLIVGREITQAQEPAKAAAKLGESIKEL